MTSRYAGNPGWIEEFRPWTPKNAEHNVRLRPERLDKPLHWRKPSLVFVDSMSDLFHELIPDDYILQVFDVMRRCTWRGGANLGRIRDEHREGHIFQILTKRPERMADFVNRLTFDPELGLMLDGPGGVFANPDIWFGTSVENDRWKTRLDALRAINVPLVTRFVSFEPLLGSLGDDVDLTGIDWAIVGAESGAGRRPYEMAWAREIRDACHKQGTAFFYKQSGALRSGHHPYMTEEDGTCWEWHQYPGDLAEPVLVHASGQCAEYGVKQESLAL